MKLIREHLLFLTILLAVVIILGKHLNPFDDGMFTFHDESQASRIQQYTLNLTHLQIPPRIAPDFSFHMGFPVFNFYAPSAYVIAGVLHLLWIPVIPSLKLSFLLALIVAATSTYLFLNRFFDKEASVVGAILYVTCLYLPVDIFVRGNLAEVWFIAFLPLALYALANASHSKRSIASFMSALLAVHFVFTSHNILSLLAIPIVMLYALSLPEKKKIYTIIFLGFLSASYFLLPLLVESSFTYATYVATLTKYADHFLCANQLWQSPWGYGGSAPGCTADGMSFKLGKLNILIALVGVGVFVWSFFVKKNLKKNKQLYAVTLGFILLTIGSLWMTTYQSEALWKLFPFLNVIQFPWRFISLSIIGLSFIGAYGWSYLRIPYKMILTAGICFVLIATVAPYFYKEELSHNEYMSSYASDTYIESHVAYTVAEYLPKTADYNLWRQYERKTLPYDTTIPAQSLNGIGFSVLTNGPFEKSFKSILSGPVALNIHYFPIWNISINNNPYIPVQFDPMGRPILSLTQGDEVHISAQQTTTELAGDFISIAAILIAIYICIFPDLWKKKHSLKT